jgi:hypothetical protein
MGPILHTKNHDIIKEKFLPIVKRNHRNEERKKKASVDKKFDNIFNALLIALN